MRVARKSQQAAQNQPGRASASSSPAPPITPPPRRRRSPIALIAGLLFVALGTLAVVWAFNSRGEGESVVALRGDVARGEVISAEDLVEARITTDPAVRTVPSGQQPSIIGQRALVDLAAGSVLTPNSFGESIIPNEGMSVVGVSLSSAMAPGMDLTYGDQVRVVITPGPQEAPDQAPAPIQAVVVAVHTPQTPGAGESRIVDVQVSSDQAAVLAARAASGQVALVLDARER